MFDELEFCRYLGSIHFLIPTRQICELQHQVEQWIKMNSCGAIVYGPSRCGKTSAIQYITTHLREVYGDALPVYIYTATNHIPTQKTFYESLLLKLGHSDASKGSANQMRIRIVNRLISDALNTKYQMVILFIDEAYLLDEKEFVWLIDMYNELSLNDVLLTVILVGTKELKNVKKGFIRSGKQQIVQRFMMEEVQFRGIESQVDLSICLASIDSSVVLHGEKIILSKEFFPHGYADGYSLAASAEDFWNAVVKLKNYHGIAAQYLTMKCFVDTVKSCLLDYGAPAGDRALYVPDQSAWEKALIKAGYVSSQVGEEK